MKKFLKKKNPSLKAAKPKINFQKKIKNQLKNFQFKVIKKIKNLKKTIKKANSILKFYKNVSMRPITMPLKTPQIVVEKVIAVSA